MAILQGARITGSIIATSFIKAAGFSGSLTASNLYVLGKAGIGTTSPNDKLDVVGRVYAYRYIAVNSNASSPAYATDTSTGMYNAGTNIIGFSISGTEKLRIDTAGNLGIGTTSPIGKLQVGSATFNGGNGVYTNDRIGVMLNGSLTSYVYASTYNDPTYPDYGFVFIHGTNTSNYNVWSISPDGPAKGSGLHFIYGANATNIHSTTPKISFIGSSGNVGIGTTSPKQSLTIFGEISLRNNDAYYWNAYYSSGFKYIGTGYAGYTIIDSTGAYTINTTNSSGTADAVASMVTRMYISSSGNVGIGTTSPLTKLNLSGGSGAVYQTFTDTTNAYHHGYVGKNGGGLVFGFSSQNGSFSADEKMRIDTTGNVGIGTSSPSYKLDVAGGIKIGGEETLPFAIGSMYLSYNSAINRIYYGDGTGYDLRFSKRGAGATTDFVTFKDTGNVGIGTSSPVNKLHVSGSSTNLPLKLEGLTSNATGYFLTVDNTTGVVYKSTGGANGTSGTSGANGGTGSSGISGSSGTSGASGASGTSGTSGTTNIKAWVHFDGTGTPTINASLNVSSITDNNTGDYTINFTTAFANANYVVAGTVTYEYENPGQSINNMFIAVPRRPTAQLAGSCRISTTGSDNVLYDCKYVRVLFSN